jgi:hypothetical protein
METYEIKLSRGLENFKNRGISLNKTKPPAIRSSINLRIKAKTKNHAYRIAQKQMGKSWRIIKSIV